MVANGPRVTAPHRVAKPDRFRSVSATDGKAARRDLLIQCRRCHAKGTATVRYDHRGVAVAVTFAGLPVDRSKLRHRDCDGAIRMFDLKGGQ